MQANFTSPNTSAITRTELLYTEDAAAAEFASAATASSTSYEKISLNLFRLTCEVPCKSGKHQQAPCQQIERVFKRNSEDVR